VYIRKWPHSVPKALSEAAAKDTPDFAGKLDKVSWMVRLHPRIAYENFAGRSILNIDGSAGAVESGSAIYHTPIDDDPYVEANRIVGRQHMGRLVGFIMDGDAGYVVIFSIATIGLLAIRAVIVNLLPLL
jgi:hypothetical protein